MSENVPTVSGKKVIIGLILILVLFVGGWFYAFGRIGLWVKVAYRAEVGRYKDHSIEEYLKLDTRYQAMKIAVDAGDAGVPIILPQFKVESEPEQFVAAMLMGAVLRQGYATTTGDESPPAVSHENLLRIAAGLRELRDAADAPKHLVEMIDQDLAKVPEVDRPKQ
jgi:hypothetical protein